MLPPGLLGLLHRLSEIPQHERTAWQAQAIGELEVIAMVMATGPGGGAQQAGAGMAGGGLGSMAGGGLAGMTGTRSESPAWRDRALASIVEKGTGTGFDPTSISLPERR